jgi:clan AA aspartic protease (TIGR02281 family)
MAEDQIQFKDVIRVVLRIDMNVIGSVRKCGRGVSAQNRSLCTAILLTLSGITLFPVPQAHAESIAMKREDGLFVVPVVVDDRITLGFIIDSGATDVTIPADVVSTLIRAGSISPSDYLGETESQLADGSTSVSKEIRIQSLRIGSVEVRNVTAMVVPGAGSLLLGQSFLARLPSWSIDNQRHLLVFRSGTDSPDWQQLGANERGGVTLYVDTASVQGSGIRTIWMKAVYAPHTQRGIAENSNKWVSREIMRDAFDCIKKTSRLEQLVWYYEDGSESRIRPFAVPTPWEPVIPESAGAREMKAACDGMASLGSR